MFRPWLFVVSAFLLLIAAWTSLIIVVAKCSPEQVALKTEAQR